MYMSMYIPDALINLVHLVNKISGAPFVYILPDFPFLLDNKRILILFLAEENGNKRSPREVSNAERKLI